MHGIASAKIVIYFKYPTHNTFELKQLTRNLLSYLLFNKTIDIMVPDNYKNHSTAWFIEGCATVIYVLPRSDFVGMVVSFAMNQI